MRARADPGDRSAAGRRLDRCRGALRPGRQRTRTSSSVEDYIQMGVDEGAELVVDGRGFQLQGHEKGFFIGPTLFDHVKPDMQHLQGGDFRPRPADRPRRELRGGARPAHASISTATASPSSPATATPRASSRRASRSAWSASTCRSRCRSPITPSAAGSARAFGDTNQHGMEGVRFCTKTKTVTARWPEGRGRGPGLRHSRRCSRVRADPGGELLEELGRQDGWSCRSRRGPGSARRYRRRSPGPVSSRSRPAPRGW